MALTIIDNRVVITETDSTTGWTSAETLVLFTADPFPVEASTCLGMAVSEEVSFAYFTTSSVDLSGGVLVYAWILANGTMDTTENGGIQLVLGDGTNRIGYHLAGSDGAAFRHSEGPVGWQCLVLDTAHLPTSFFTAHDGDEASLNLSAITDFGIAFATLSKALGGASNCFFDIIRIGNGGLTIVSGTAGDPGTFAELAAADRSTGSLEAYGICRELGAGVFGLQGPLTFGDDVGIAPTVFADINVSVVFEDRFIGADKYGITVVGNTTAETTFSLGTKVGSGDTAGGANGVTFVVPNTTLSGTLIGDPSASFIAGDADLQRLIVYGSKFDGFTGGVTLSSDETNAPNHEWIGNQIVGSGQADIGRVLARTDAFDNNQEASGSAVLWGSASIDVRNSSFQSNHFGIEHIESGAFDYSGLTFADNDFDVLNASSGAMTISVVGGGDTPTVFNSGSATTLVIAATQVTLTGMTSGSEVIVLDVDDGSTIAQVENVGDTGNFAFTDDAGNIVNIFIHALDQVWQSLTDFVIPSQDTEIPIQQQFDRNYQNPD